MTVPLSVRVGDRNVTSRIDDLMIRDNVHGTAEIGFRLAQPLDSDIPAFERVYVYDGTSADTIADGRLEDPGRTLDESGERWDASAIGEQARAHDQAAALIYVDTDLARWIREQLSRATSANAQPSDLPSATGTDCLLMQYPPGQPIDDSSTIVMAYRAIEEAGMEIGGIEYTAVAGFSPVGDFEYRLFAKPAAGGLIRQNVWSTTPVSRYATLSDATPLPAGTTRVELTAPRVSGGATNVISDNLWAAFYGVVVKAARYNLDGTLHTTNADYLAGRMVYPHEVVTDLLGRGLLPTFDAVNASIDTSSTHAIDQLAYPDGITPEALLADLMELEPDFYWHVGPVDPATGLSPFTWRRWPTHIRYETSLRDGVSLPGADAERFNRVTYRWRDRKERIQTKTYNAGTTIAGVAVPVVDALETAGPGGTRLIRQPEIQDLADEIGSEAAADQAAAGFLLAHAEPPASGTLTIAHKVYDHDLGRYVQPWEIKPGHLLRIRERGEAADDLSATDRDGRCCFRLVGRTYTVSSNSAQLELDAPPRTDQNLLAAQISRRERKR